MGKVSAKEVLRTVVLKEFNGVATIKDILCHHSFQEGYNITKIGALTIQLRHDYEGHANGGDMEAWRRCHNTIYGLESKIPFDVRKDISNRRKSLEHGIAAYSLKDNQIFEARIKKDGFTDLTREEIARSLGINTQDLERLTGSSILVKHALKEHEGEFQSEEP